MKQMRSKHANRTLELSNRNRQVPMKRRWTLLGVLATLASLAGCGSPGSSNSPHGLGMPTAATTANGESGEGSAVDSNASAAAETPAAQIKGKSGNGNPNATFKGCWHKQRGHRYQAVDITVGKPGTYAFNAVLYRGTTCNPTDIADQFGFGQLLNFGGFGYTFWFTDFHDQSNMSAIWYVGDENSKCVSYAAAPNC
jgi:predicted small lipoprotein YifL